MRKNAIGNAGAVDKIEVYIINLLPAPASFLLEQIKFDYAIEELLLLDENIRKIVVLSEQF